MPLYTWWGITLDGQDHYGKVVARSEVHLQDILLQQEIALLRSSALTPRIPQRSWHARTLQWLSQLITLLEVGIYVDQALELIKVQESNGVLKTMWEDILLEIHTGASLAQALSKYPTFFDSLTRQVISAGQESGTLLSSLKALAAYYQDVAQWRQEIRQALAGPLLTLSFFLIIITLIIVFILPHFSSFFSATGQTLPPLTAFLLSTSSWLKTWGLGVFLFLVGLGGVGYYYGTKTAKVKNKIYTLLWHVPVVGRLRKLFSVYQFCQVLSLLLSGGISIKPALCLLEDAQGRSSAFTLFIDSLKKDILEGMSVHDAFGRHPDLFSSQLIAFIRIGQESATLPAMLLQGAHMYHQQTLTGLRTITFFLQPLLMVLLGLLVAALIIAVYVPILTLSYSVA